MKQKRRIGRMVAGIVAVSFVVIFGFVHLFLRLYMKQEAERAIRDYEEMLQEDIRTFNEESWYDEDDWEEDSDWEDEISDASLFQVLYLETGTDYALGEGESEYFHGERAILAWCKAHAAQAGEIVPITTGGQTYFVEQFPFAITLENEQSERIAFLCVNVSTALWMFRVTELIMAMIMLLCTIVAAWLGHKMEVSIQREQEKQKRFFENASHELKTPLMSIQGFAEGLRDGVIKDADHAYAVIVREAQRMAKLVDEILFLSKYDQQTMELSSEMLSVEEMVGDCLDALEAEIRKRKITITTEIEDCFLTGDGEQMQRAVSNLLSNALRYAKSEIRISFREKTLIVWDDGEALSEQELRHIFDRFYTGKGGSTGIGLALAREILKAHGFTLSAENADGGVRFVVKEI